MNCRTDFRCGRYLFKELKTKKGIPRDGTPDDMKRVWFSPEHLSVALLQSAAPRHRPLALPQRHLCRSGLNTRSFFDEHADIGERSDVLIPVHNTLVDVDDTAFVEIRTLKRILQFQRFVRRPLVESTLRQLGRFGFRRYIWNR